MIVWNRNFIARDMQRSVRIVRCTQTHLDKKGIIIWALYHLHNRPYIAGWQFVNKYRDREGFAENKPDLHDSLDSFLKIN